MMWEAPRQVPERSREPENRVSVFCGDTQGSVFGPFLLHGFYIYSAVVWTTERGGKCNFFDDDRGEMGGRSQGTSERTN